MSTFFSNAQIFALHVLHKLGMMLRNFLLSQRRCISFLQVLLKYVADILRWFMKDWVINRSPRAFEKWGLFHYVPLEKKNVYGSFIFISYWLISHAILSIN